MPLILYDFNLLFGWFFVLLFIGHLLTDLITSKFTTKFWINGEVKKFFTTIGFDQFIHIVHLLFLVKYFLWWI